MAGSAQGAGALPLPVAVRETVLPAASRGGRSGSSGRTLATPASQFEFSDGGAFPIDPKTGNRVPR